MVRVFCCRNPTPVSVFIFLFLSFHNLVSSVGDCLESSIVFYFILFWASLVGRWFIAQKFLKKVDFVSNVVVYSFLS